MSGYRYYPKRPVKSFLDLEVYQKTYGLAVEVVKRLMIDFDRSFDSQSPKGPEVKNQPKIGVGMKETILENLIKTVLKIPDLIAKAHSIRFGRSEASIDVLEETMLKCNLAVVLLGEYRDLVNQKIEAEYFEEQIKEYFRVRGKILRLQRSWLKFMVEKEK